jgi:c-di-GMP-binding flagellar brake protein YcgR
VEIESTGGKVRRLYHSQVVDVSHSRITLAAPRQEGAIVPLAVGDRIGVVVKQRPYSYRFESTVLARERLPLPVVVVEHKHDLVRFERREFARSDVNIDCRFELFYGSGVMPTELERPGRILDISGSGCRLETFGATHKVRFVVMEFRLPTDFPLTPAARRGRREAPRPLRQARGEASIRRSAPAQGERAGRRGEAPPAAAVPPPKAPPRRPVHVLAEVVPAASRGLGVPQGGMLGCRFIEIAAGDRENVVAFVLAAERGRLHIRRERDLSKAEAQEPTPTEGATHRPARRGN